MESLKFQYEEFIGRNIGFVSPEEQESIRKARVFIPGVGGMGGTALESLVRLGVENFIIADFDVFEISNLNRQIFCTLDSVGKEKTKSAAERILKINPNAKLQIYGKNWTEKLDSILPQVDFAINGCDDTKATIFLMRKAKEHGKTVIDAFSSPLPSVYVVHPERPRPEVVMKFPSRNLPWEKIDSLIEKQCQLQEVKYVLTHSSSHKHIIWKYAQELIEGKRKRFSLSPMVSMTGHLMSYEALKLILKQRSVVDERGVFYNPWKARVEKPRPGLVAFFKAFLVERFLSRN